MLNLSKNRVLAGLSALLALLALGAGCAHPRDIRNLPVAAMRAPAGAEFSVDRATLIREIDQRKARIGEFMKLAEWGKARGIRIWAAGGTAAGLAHYVKMDLEREAIRAAGGPPKFYEGRFGYAYFDVYRSTQDADIIIDADEATARELEAYLKSEFKYLQGSKEIWEVRLLRNSRGTGAGEKEPVLENTNFSQQNTDSHSVGVIELTDPPAGESSVRDLLDWDDKLGSQFLSDVVDGELHFYRNRRHGATKRFLANQNPEILSVIRYYTKAFQYGLKTRPQDEGKILAIVRAFDPANPSHANDYALNQIAKNALKLYWHSQDVEASRNVLKKIGLLDKLVDFGQKHGKGELVTWLSREPLPTFPLGGKKSVIRPYLGYSPSYKTARELNLTELAHETRTFLAYESIAMSKRGKINAFISRNGARDEAAIYGDGFYMRVGKKGAVGSGLTIRAHLDPAAVEGVDFYLAASDYVVVLNSAAVRVLDDSIDVTPVGYIHTFLHGGISGADAGMLKKFEMKAKSKFSVLTEADRDEMGALLVAVLRKPESTDQFRNACTAFSEWSRLDSKARLKMTPVDAFRFLVNSRSMTSQARSTEGNSLEEIFGERIEISGGTSAEVSKMKTWLFGAPGESLDVRNFVYGVDLWLKASPGAKLTLSEYESLYSRTSIAYLLRPIGGKKFDVSSATTEEVAMIYRVLTEEMKRTPSWELIKIWAKLPGREERIDLVREAIGKVQKAEDLSGLLLIEELGALPEFETLYREAVKTHPGFEIELFSRDTKMFAAHPRRSFFVDRLNEIVQEQVFAAGEIDGLKSFWSDTIKLLRPSAADLMRITTVDRSKNPGFSYFSRSSTARDGFARMHVSPSAMADPEWPVAVRKYLEWVLQRANLEEAGRVFTILVANEKFRAHPVFAETLDWLAPKLPFRDLERVFVLASAAEDSVVKNYVKRHYQQLFGFWRGKSHVETVLAPTVERVPPWTALTADQHLDIFDRFFADWKAQLPEGRARSILRMIDMFGSPFLREHPRFEDRALELFDILYTGDGEHYALSRQNFRSVDFDYEKVLSKFRSVLAADHAAGGVRPRLLALLNGKDAKPKTFLEKLSLAFKKPTDRPADYFMGLSQKDFDAHVNRQLDRGACGRLLIGVDLKKRP